MSEHERQEFLAGLHVGVISVERVDGPPLPGASASARTRRSRPSTGTSASRDRRPLARRYFGPELGDAYLASTDGADSLKFSMRPTRWWSVDYAKS